MKKILFVPVALISISFYNIPGKKNNVLFEDRWTGTIIFRQITYDTIYGTHTCGWQTDTSWSEWRMQANIRNNNEGIAISSLNGRSHGYAEDTCKNVNGTGANKDTLYANGQSPTYLDIGIDYETKEYGFT